MATNSSILAWVNPMDGGIWCPTGHRVAKSHAQLKQLSTQLTRLMNFPTTAEEKKKGHMV